MLFSNSMQVQKYTGMENVAVDLWFAQVNKEAISQQICDIAFWV
jgi:hypothetical protein